MFSVTKSNPIAACSPIPDRRFPAHLALEKPALRRQFLVLQRIQDLKGSFPTEASLRTVRLAGLRVRRLLSLRILGLLILPILRLRRVASPTYVLATFRFLLVLVLSITL